MCASKPEFSYVLTGFAVSMFTVDSCTGQFTPATPASVSTGYAFPQIRAEEMVADPLGRFAYVANLVSNATDLATISSFTINSTTGVLTPTSQASVPTGFFPQEIAIDPLGRFVYTANSDDATVSMFTITQTTGVLTPNTLVPNTLAYVAAGNAPTGIAVDPTNRFAYVVNRIDNTVSMYTVDPNTGNLTLNSSAANPTATIATGVDPFRIDFDLTGKFVYVTNEGSAASIYTVNSDGTLIPAGTTGVATGGLAAAFTVSQ